MKDKEMKKDCVDGNDCTMCNKLSHCNNNNFNNNNLICKIRYYKAKDELYCKERECKLLKAALKNKNFVAIVEENEKLKQECEELKKTISTSEGVSKLFENSFDDSCIKIDRYKQALEKIEEFCITYSDNHDAYETVYKYILAMINEVKDE